MYLVRDRQSPYYILGVRASLIEAQILATQLSGAVHDPDAWHTLSDGTPGYARRWNRSDLDYEVVLWNAPQAPVFVVQRGIEIVSVHQDREQACHRVVQRCGPDRHEWTFHNSHGLSWVYGETGYYVTEHNLEP